MRTLSEVCIEIENNRDNFEVLELIRGEFWDGFGDWSNEEVEYFKEFFKPIWDRCVIADWDNSLIEFLKNKGHK